MRVCLIVNVLGAAKAQRLDDLFDPAHRLPIDLMLGLRWQAMELFADPADEQRARNRPVTFERAVDGRQPFFCAASVSVFVWKSAGLVSRMISVAMKSTA